MYPVCRLSSCVGPGRELVPVDYLYFGDVSMQNLRKLPNLRSRMCQKTPVSVEYEEAREPYLQNRLIKPCLLRIYQFFSLSICV